MHGAHPVNRAAGQLVPARTQHRAAEGRTEDATRFPRTAWNRTERRDRHLYASHRGTEVPQNAASKRARRRSHCPQSCRVANLNGNPITAIRSDNAPGMAMPYLIKCIMRLILPRIGRKMTRQYEI
jgi:hypothetical protein